MTERMNKEEYREFKRQERAEVFDTLSEATQELLSADKLKEYADMQAKLSGLFASNVLLVMEQKPEASWVRTFDDWKEDNVSLKKGEKGILTLAPDYYQKPDGTTGRGVKVVRIFDISQTTAENRTINRPVYRGATEMLMECWPKTVEAQELLGGETAFYDPQKQTIFLKEGLDPDTKFFMLAREHAVAIETKGNILTREEVIGKAEFSAYLVTKRYGMNPPDIDFGKMADSFRGREEKDVREELGGMRFTADRIHQKVQEQLEQNRETKGMER